MNSTMKKSNNSTTISTKFLIILISTSIIHLICYKATISIKHSQQRSSLNTNNLIKRSNYSYQESNNQIHSISSEPPLLYQESQVEEVPTSLIDYRSYWENATNSTKPFVFISLALWLTFLFAFVGITAADFFCPNLSTIASRLGMSESVAGVTFLAFSNGSPDVFSTFAALRTNSAALAIGELLGAASFIVSVVAGTMCVIQPFRVSKHSFLRDVGFFTIAVMFTLGILYDNHIHAWEAIAMVSLYLVYVAVVGAQSWWLSRKSKRDALIREARDEYAVEIGEEGDYLDDPQSAIRSRPHTRNNSSTSIVSPINNRSSYFNSPITPHSNHFRIQETFQSLTSSNNNRTRSNTLSNNLHMTQSNNSISNSNLTRRPKTRSTVRPSLLGAIEFRDVVNSLRADSTARTLAVFDNGEEEDGNNYRDNNIIEEDNNNNSSIIRRPSGRLSRSTSISGIQSNNLLPESNPNSNSLISPPGNNLNNNNSTRPKHSRKVSWSPGMTLGKPQEEDERGFWEDTSPNIEPIKSIGDEINTGGIGNRSRNGSVVNHNGNNGDNPWQATMDRRPLRLDLSNLPSPNSETSSRHNKTPNALISPLLNPSISNQSNSNQKTIRKVPSILLTNTSGTQSTVLAARRTPINFKSKFLKLKQSETYRITRAVFLALFPSLQDFNSKSWVGKATALLCVPAILVLNLTLPVVDSDEEDDNSLLEKDQVSEEGNEQQERGEESQFLVEEEEEENNLIDLSSERNYSNIITNNDFFSSRPKANQSRQSFTPTGISSPDLSQPSSPTDREAKHNREAIAKQFHSRAVPHPEIPLPTFESSLEEEEQEQDIGGVEIQRFRMANNDESVNKIPNSRGVSMSSSLNEENEENEEDRNIRINLSNGVLTRWLTAVQCTLAPVFCVTALFGYDTVWWYPIIALILGLTMASTAFYYFEDPKHPGRLSLCFVGFFVAMVWILTIVNEVVGVLQTFGHIFEISDAILGLTIFAMGNSLGDLVANATVARMGFPSMAIAACFGGPMLNILLGIGLSGSYVIFKNGGEPYEVLMGPSLLVSGIGLLIILIGTLIIIPLNEYYMNKQIGMALILAYGIVLSTTVAVEIWS